MTTENTTSTPAAETDWAAKIGAPAFDSIREMVAALDCEYDRLEELRELQASWKADADNQPHTDGDGLPVVPTWANENPDDAQELKELEEAAGECKDREDAERRIMEDPLSIQVRSDWYTPGDEDESRSPAEFQILLCTGGPAVRIVGELGGDGEPSRARLEVQDWFKPWTEYVPADSETLLTYARCFCFDRG
jgi:hypothetical protein